MELTSIIGFAVSVAIVGIGLLQANVGWAMFSIHGLSIVVIGTLGSVLFHCQWAHIKRGVAGFVQLFRSSPYRRPEEIIPVLVNLSERARARNPVVALREVPEELAGGFLREAADVAMQNAQNPDLVRSLLERNVNFQRMDNNEVVNVFRAASVLSPMYGLIGTLIGIIEVLRNISNPENIGSPMATAISSAFFGIAFSNILYIPVAGKLRMCFQQEFITKALVVEGLVQIIKGEMPLMVEQHLWAFLKQEKPAGGPPVPAVASRPAA